MTVSRSSRRKITSVGVFLTIVAMAGCGGGGEESSLLRNFFTASRVNDRATLGNIAMVAFDINTDGNVSGFDLESVSEETRRPLSMQALAGAVREAQQTQQDFAGEMRMYQDENLDAIARVIEAERADEDVRSSDQEVQEQWTVYREESQSHSRAVSDAENALTAESSVASVSAFDPNNPIAVQEFGGTLVSKVVTIHATVELNEVETERTLVISLEKVELDGPDGLVDGRWVISNIS